MTQPIQEFLPFRDRYDAGHRLAPLLEKYREEKPVILALPRGGVPVANPIASALNAPLDVLVARKLGAPGHQELGIGAVAPGARFLDQNAIAVLRVPESYLAAVTKQEIAELERRERLYRGDRPPLDLAGRTVILIDDGLATGVTAQAAIASVRTRHPRRVVFAAPVCAPDSVARLRETADAVICLACPANFMAVGQWYQDFSPTSDAEVLACLGRRESPAVPA
jgi:putative phosphoribosyl transferase